MENKNYKKAIDVSGAHDSQHRNIGVYRKHKGSNQQWEIIYVDEYPEEPKTGQMDKTWGLRVGTPFHIKSGLASGRYIDHLSRKMVIKTPNERNTQLFYFNYRTKTIASFNNKGWSFDIVSSGRSNRMQMYNTNSGWW